MLVFLANSFQTFAQKEKWLTFDPSNQKREIRWAITGYAGWHTRFFDTRPRSEKGFNSTKNWGLDLKREVKPDLFLCLHNRMRFDDYYLEVPDFSVTQAYLAQSYFIHSHAFSLEKRIKFQRVFFLIGGGLGINFIHQAGIGMGSSKDGSNINFTYSTQFLEANMGINGFAIINLGAEVELLKNFYAHYNFSLSYDFTKFSPIVPYEVNNQGKTYFIEPTPRKWNSWLQLGLTYRL